MDAEFWLERWREGRTGWHQRAASPLLVRHWAEVGAPPGSRVLVPLAGKTLDMLWLAEEGYRVLGVELSPLAVAQFFDEHYLSPQVEAISGGLRYRAGEIEILQGNIFEFDAHEFASCSAIYDRAALVALPPEQRRRYVRQVYGHMPARSCALVVTFEYPQSEMEGPPFSVDKEVLERQFGADWQIDLLACRDILHEEPQFAERGASSIFTGVYRLRRR
jgi:thiopurine S-methyltransferase